jgi:hypothetical protein
MSLQRQRVRASCRISATFTLLMVSSPGFGSSWTNYIRAIHARFHYAFPQRGVKQIDTGNSPAHSSIGTTSLLQSRRNSNFQIPKSKQIPISKFQNVLNFVICDFDIVCDLVLGA